MVFGLVVGGAVGAIAGYYGGKVDEVIMKLIDTQMAFPGVLLALMLIAVFGNGIQKPDLGTGGHVHSPGLPGSPAAASSNTGTRSLSGRPGPGALGDGRIIFRHILPNIVPELIVTSSLGFAGAVMSEAGLSYLGLASSPPPPVLAKCSARPRGRSSRRVGMCWYALSQSTLLVMGFNLIGDALQEVTQHGR